MHYKIEVNDATPLATRIHMGRRGRFTRVAGQRVAVVVSHLEQPGGWHGVHLQPIATISDILAQRVEEHRPVAETVYERGAYADDIDYDGEVPARHSRLPTQYGQRLHPALACNIMTPDIFTLLSRFQAEVIAR